MAITADQVKELRKISGAGMMDCKKALQDGEGDIEKALDILRTKGLADLMKKSGRIASEGRIDSYIHQDGNLGVLIEVNCETDFVAKNEKFIEFVHDLAMQVAASNPHYISRDDVPEEIVKKEEDIYKQQAKDEGKPDNVIEKIVSGKLDKFYQKVCLLEQYYIKDDSITIEKYLGDIVSQLGENIIIRRFVRFKVGQIQE